MNIGELMLSIKSGKLSDLYPVSKINSHNIEAIANDGYSWPVTKEDFESKFPWIPVEHVYIGKIMTEGSLFYDPARYMCFSLHIYGGNIIMPDTEDGGKKFFETMYEQFLSAFHSKQYRFLIHMCPDAYRIELLGNILKTSNDEGLLELFRDQYIHSDYGFDNLPIERIVELYAQAPPSFKEKVKSHFGNQEKIVIYRGEGDKSTPYKKAMSWTTSLKTACFFAIRYTKEEARVIQAEIKVNDILDYIDDRGEYEVLVRPKTCKLIEVILFKGMDYLTSFYWEETLFKEAKKLYKKKSGEHGLSHTCRMLALEVLINEEVGFSRNERRILTKAITYHDLGRVNELEDTIHGEASAKLFKKHHPDDKDLDIIMDIVKYHCIDDEKAFEELSKSDNSEIKIKLLKWLKDIDALDRVRFGLNDVDIRYFRHKETMTFMLVAHLLLRYKF